MSQTKTYFRNGGKLIGIIPVSVDTQGINVTTIYAAKSIEPKAKTKHSEHSAKSRRILAALESSVWPLSGAELSRIGSGKPGGFCLSFSKEISRLRNLGHHIVIVRTERVNGQTVNYYKLNPESVE